VPEYVRRCAWRECAFTSISVANLPILGNRRMTTPPRGLRLTLSGGTQLPTHAHHWDQLVYAREGVLTVITDGELAGNTQTSNALPALHRWIVPRTLAVWLPAGLRHSLRADVRATLDAVYVQPAIACGAAWRAELCPMVLGVSPLMRELIAFVVDSAMSTSRPHPLVTPDSLTHAAALLVGIARTAPVNPLRMREPRDARARAVASILGHAPDDARNLEALGRTVGASARTLERLFLAETGLTFREWRQQVRLEHALRALAGGSSVSAVASAVGYESASAFIAMFKRRLGVTPSAYYPAGM